MEIDEDEYNELYSLMIKYKESLRKCMCAIQGYKDTNPLNPESVLAKALDSAKEALKDE